MPEQLSTFVKLNVRITILYITVIFLSAVQAIAQNPKHWADGLSTEFGVSFNYMRNDTMYDEDLNRMRLGLSKEFSLNDKLFLEPAIFLTAKGGRSFYPLILQSFTLAESSLRLKYYSSNWISFTTGPQVGRVLSSFVIDRGSKQIITNSPYERIAKEYEISWFAGVNVKITESLSLSLNGSHSIVKPGLAPHNYKNFQINTTFILDLGEARNAIISNRKYNKEKDQELLKLRDGSLLVMLNERSHLISYYKRENNQRMVDKIISNRDSVNEQLVKAFNNYYSFGKVYFISSADIQRFYSGERTSIIRNSNGEIVDTLNSPIYVFNPGNLYFSKQAVTKNGYHFKNEFGFERPYPFPKLSAYPNDESWVEIEELVKKLNRKLVLRAQELQAD